MAKMKAFNLNEFTSELGKRGAAKSHNFAVSITPPESLKNIGFKEGAPWLPLRIESVNLPSRSLMTLEQRYHGPVRYIPYSVIYTPVTLTIILSDNMVEREFFMAWQDLAMSVPDGKKTQRNNFDGGVLWADKGDFDASYYDNIIGTTNIYQFPENPALQGRGGGSAGLLSTISGVASAVGFDPSIISRPLGFDIGAMFGGSSVPDIKATGEIKLRECYPRTVNEVSMNWGSDEIAKLQVEMIYFDFLERFNTEDPPGPPDMGIAGMARKGMNMINKFKPLVGGIARGGLGSLAAGATGSAGNVMSNITIF